MDRPLPIDWNEKSRLEARRASHTAQTPSDDEPSDGEEYASNAPGDTVTIAFPPPPSQDQGIWQGYNHDRWLPEGHVPPPVVLHQQLPYRPREVSRERRIPARSRPEISIEYSRDHDYERRRPPYHERSRDYGRMRRGPIYSGRDPPIHQVSHQESTRWDPTKAAPGISNPYMQDLYGDNQTASSKMYNSPRPPVAQMINPTQDVPWPSLVSSSEPAAPLGPLQPTHLSFPRQSADPRSRLRPTHSSLQHGLPSYDERPYPHHYPQRPQDVGWHAPQYSPQYSDEEWNISSSEDDIEWLDIDLADSEHSSEPDLLLNDVSPFQPSLLPSSTDADNDLLYPMNWTSKLHSIETAIKQNYSHRRFWPTTWRHSDSKTCPKVLQSAWSDILDVDHNVNKLGLDAVMPTFDGRKHHLKTKGTLIEVVTAHKARSAKGGVQTIRPKSPQKSTSMLGIASWDHACEQFQKLLKVRDYLVAVCRDAEYLNEIHPTLDTITWFEQAELINEFGTRTVRSQVVEIKSISISHVAAVIQSVNAILRALLWGWSDESLICLEPINKAADRQDNLANLYNWSQQLVAKYPKLVASKAYSNGENRIRACLETLDMGLEALTVELQAFAAILDHALFNQCDVHICPKGSRDTRVTYGYVGFSGLFFTPRKLNCMDAFIQGREVWVLMNHRRHGEFSSLVVSPKSYPNDPSLPLPSVDVRTTITDLARIWGPIWKSSEPEEGGTWVWYQLPGGYIGASDHHERNTMSEQPDESLCHFSTDTLDFRTLPHASFYVPDKPFLLIGRGLPATLVQRKSCHTKLESGLEGLEIQPIGTLRPFKYKDSMTVQIGAGYSGAQANWSTQIKTNPGILAKEKLLQRWKLEPRFRNPRLLLLWDGVEVSLCTKNARRCRIIDLLRSRLMIQYVSTIYRPEMKSDSTICKESILDALKSDDPNALIELYVNHSEWQAEIGAVIARCLDILKETGVNRSGDLTAFAFIERFHDPEQLAVLPRKHHTWIGLLKDSADTATFALVSHQCLGYPAAPGRMCQQKDSSIAEVKTVLETGYTTTNRTDVIQRFKSMKPRDRLGIQNLSKFKIHKKSSRGILLGTWEKRRFEYLHLPNSAHEQYRERRQDGEQVIKVFVVSQKGYRPIRIKHRPTTVSLTNESTTTSHPTGSNNDSENTTNLSSTSEISHQQSASSLHSTTDNPSLPPSVTSQPESCLPQSVSSNAHSNATLIDKSTQTATDRATQTEDLRRPDPISVIPTSPLPSSDLLSPTVTNGGSKSSSSHHRRHSHRRDTEYHSSSRHRHGHGSHSRSDKAYHSRKHRSSNQFEDDDRRE